MNDINAQLNQVPDCIKDSNNFGHTLYYNICTGERSLVPWGSFDITMCIVSILVLSGIVFAIYKDLKD